LFFKKKVIYQLPKELVQQMGGKEQHWKPGTWGLGWS